MGMLEAQVKQLMEEKQELAAEKATLAGQNAVLSQANLIPFQLWVWLHCYPHVNPSYKPF